MLPAVAASGQTELEAAISKSIALHAGIFNQLAPLGYVRFDNGCELFRRACHGLGADGQQSGFDFILFDEARYQLIQLGDRRFRRFGGREEAGAGHRFETGQAGSGNRR